MRCSLCGGVACEELDPRLPLLRIPSCSHCRDIVAYQRGWARGQKFKRGKLTLRIWRRGPNELVEVAT